MASTWRRLRRDPLALLGMATVAAVSFAALTAPAIAPFDPTEQFFDGLTLEGAPLPPSETFLLGTDLLGRDLLSRLLYGARTSLIIGVVANGAAVAVGTLLGIIAGYVQGWVGAAIMRFTRSGVSVSIRSVSTLSISPRTVSTSTISVRSKF